MTNEEFASAIAGFSPTVQKDTLQEKIDKLNERTPAKIERVTGKPIELGYTTDVLKGLYDADTIQTQNLGYSRETDPYGNRYDAVEVKHGNVPYDMQGLSKEVRDAGTIGKSEYAMQMQRQQVANVFGKPVEQVTEQDMIDVANQQQVQKLADLARVPGEERWIAPLAKGSAPINLTGSYIDEFGVKQDSSLNVPILSKKMEDVGQRGGVALGNLANEEVTAQAALDPLQNAFAPGAEVTRINARLAELEKGPTERSFLDQLISSPQAFAAGAGKSAYDTVDVYTEIAGDVAGGAIGLVSDKAGKAIDKLADLGTEEEKTKRINAMVGYDNRFTANNMEKLGKSWDAAVKDVEFLSPSTWSKLDTGKLAEAAKIAFSDIETAAYSLGYMAPALAGAFGKTGAKLAGGAVKKHYDDTAANLKAVATGKMTEEAAKNAARESLEAMSKIDRTKLFLVNNADALQYGAMMNNDQMDEYIKNNGGEDATLLRNILGTAANAAGMKLDIGVMSSILKPSKGTAEVVGNFLRGTGESGSRVLIGKMAELGTKAAIAGLHEMPQEWGQTFIEEFNKIYGTKDKAGKELELGDVVSKSAREASIGALAGLAGGAHTSIGVHGAVEAAKTVPELLVAGGTAIRKGVELATETPEQKTIRQNVEYSTPLKNEAMFAAFSGNAADVVDRAEKVHGKLSAELDASAPKKHTYGKILKDALAVAQKAGDEEAINNVYKTIAELDKDENVEFKATDLVKESGYEATKKLIELINQNVDTTDSKMQGLKGQVTKDIQSNTAMEQRDAEIVALRDKVIAEKKRWSIMGTDEMDPILEPLTKVETAANEYLEGKKTLNDVNKEFAELGFMENDGKPDPSRPGLTTYEKELTNQLLNPKTNKNLLKIKEGTTGAKLTGLTKFAKSRLSKLRAKGTKDAYQTPAMISEVKAENEKMLKTIANVLKVAKGLKDVDEATRIAYEDELATAENAAIESNKELYRRNAILDTVVKPEGIAGALAFQVDADGESIQAVTYKDGEPVKVKIADVIDNKVIPLEKYAETKVEVIEPAVEVKEPVGTVIESAKIEVAKEQDLSNLTKKQQEFMAKYKAGKMKHTAGLTRRYNELLEKAKQPKEVKPAVKPVKKESRARQIKAAAEILIGEGEEEAAARVKAMFKPEDEVKTYAESLSDEDIAEQTRAMEENQKIQEQLDEEEFQKFSDSIDEIVNRPENTEETAPVEPEGPLAIINTEKTPSERANPLYTARQLMAKLSKDLSEAMAEVEDMNLKAAVRKYYKTELAKLEDKSTKIGDILWKLGEEISDRKSQNKIDKEMLNEYTKMKGVDKLIADLKVLVDSAVQILSELFAKLEKAKAERAEINTQKKKLAKDIKAILDIIEEIEAEYEAKYGAPTKNELKKSVGLITEYVDGLYGPMLDFNGNKTPIVVPDNGKYSTALNKALQKIREEKLSELKTELVNMDKGKTSLGAKLLGRLLTNFPLNSPIHKILKRGEDSVFGQLTGNMFADPARLLDVLPKGFKEFFAKDPESEEALLTNFKTMAEYIKNTEIGAIVIGKNIVNTSIDYNGLVMENITKYMPITRQLKKGDKVQDAAKNTYIVEAVEGDKINVKTTGKAPVGSIKKLSVFTGVLEKQENSVPVDIIELLGTVVDGKLQLDEQTQNILKFYSAKMLVDTQKMVGLIQSMDESEMGQVLGIYDAEEQLRVKQDAMKGYINSASIRKDIEGEVYQALGLKFNETAPEFTVESFKSALGVLVQAIAIENGSMERKKGEAGGKNQNLIKTNWEALPVERDALTKAIAKLQYLNENRNRPLPGLKKPADDNNRKVMNTENPMDKKSTAFLNKQEKIAYKISPRLARWLAMDEAEALKAMGYVDVKNAGLHVSEIDAQMARNDKLVREWEILKTFAKSVGDKKFYLKWGQTVSGRYTILNDLNYQESKLHREFIVAEGSTESVDVTDKDARQMLEASVLQGFDMDPDKLSPETASEKFNKLFKVTDKGIEVTEEGPIKTAYEAMKEGKVDAEAMAEVFADSEGHHGISSIELLVAWDKAIKDGTKLETHANLEIDAITSGMILTLLQIGSDVALRMAEKGGIYTAERLPELKKYVEKWLPGVTFTPGALIEAGKKHAAEIESKMKTAKGAELVELRKQLEDDAVFKDLYSTIGVAMIGEVQAYKEKLMGLAKPSQSQLKQLLMLEQIGELNLKNIRSIAKSPVMVFIYGATVSSIKKKLTYSLGVDTLVKALKTASKLLKDGKDASAEMNFINGLLPEDKWKFINEFGAKIPKPAEVWEQLLAVDINGVIEDIGRVINATFGKAIETAFDSRLGFVNKNRDAAKSIEILVFQAYKIRLADEVQKFLDTKYGIGRHKGETYKLSKEDLQSINQKLTDKGYGHNIVWYEDGETINQTLNKTDTKGGIHSSKVTVGKTSVGGQIKQFKPVVNTGAAPTISVHAIDGRMMLDVLNREIGGKYTGGNIYDAVVLSVNKAMLIDTADSYNTNMIETGFSRSVIADQLEMLEGMFYSKDEAGNKQFDEEMFNIVLNSIGLRPEGELRDDYTKEANRIGLCIGKMLESLERAEKVNGERLVNSGKEFHSGHLYQMGSGVVKVDASNTRAKKFPAIGTIKRLLQEKIVADRKVTHEEFAKAKIKLHKDTDYVANLDDVVKGKTQIESNANIAQIKTIEGKMSVTDKLWGSLGANDTVQILANKSTREWLESDDGKADYWAKEVIGKVLQSDAKIVADGFDEQLKESGRGLVDGVWVKKANEGKADTQEEVGKMTTNTIIEQVLECAKG